MNLFNRIVIVVLLLIAMIAIPLGFILPEQAEVVLRFAADLVAANLAWLHSLPQTAQIGMRLVLSAVGLIIFVAGLLFLGLEVLRLQRRTVRLRNGSGELVMDGVAEHLTYYVDPIEGVLNVHPKVTSKGKSVQVTLFVETAPAIGVPDKSVEINRVARQVIEERLGLELDGEVKVVIRPAAHPRERPSAAPPAQPEAQQGTEKAPSAAATRVLVAAPPPIGTVMPESPQSAEPLHESDFVVPPPAQAEATPGEASRTIEAKGPDRGGSG